MFVDGVTAPRHQRPPVRVLGWLVISSDAHAKYLSRAGIPLRLIQYTAGFSQVVIYAFRTLRLRQAAKYSFAEEDPPGTPVRRADEKEHLAAWRNLSVRKAWITTCEKPAVCGIKRRGMQALLRNLAWASDETTSQLNTPTGSSVAGGATKPFSTL